MIITEHSVYSVRHMGVYTSVTTDGRGNTNSLIIQTNSDLRSPMGNYPDEQFAMRDRSGRPEYLFEKLI